MRYLFTLWDGGGTVPVEIGVAQRLIAHGHQVTVLADPTLEDEARSAGASFRSWQRAPHRQSAALADDLLKDWEPRTPLQVFERVRDRLITGPALGFAQDVRACVRDHPVDALVSDVALLGALTGAESLGLPSVALCPNVYPRPTPGLPPFGSGLGQARGRLGSLRDRWAGKAVERMWRTGLPALNGARTELGLLPLTEPFALWDRCASVLVLTAATFDYAADLPSNVRYVGPVLADPVWSREERGDEVPSAEPGLPLVVVGLSTTFMKGQAELLQRIIDALQRLPVEAVVTRGRYVDAGTLRSTGRIRVVEAAPHSRLFASASVVITHAGHGTLLKALAAGVPTLCVPLGRDQRDNLVRAVDRGVALGLRPSASVPRIERAVRRLLTEPTFRDRAGQLGAAIRSEIESSPLIPLLEAAAQGSARRTPP